VTTARAYGGRRRSKKKPLTYDPDAWATPQWLFDELDAPPGYDGKVGSPNMGHAVLVFRGKK